MPVQYCDPSGLIAIVRGMPAKEMAIPDNAFIPVDSPPEFIFTVHHPESKAIIGTGSRVQWGPHDAILLTMHQLKQAAKYEHGQLMIGGTRYANVAKHPVHYDRVRNPTKDAEEYVPGDILFASSPNEKKGGRDFVLLKASTRVMSALGISKVKITPALEGAPVTIYSPPVQGCGWRKCTGTMERVKDVMVKYHISTDYGTSGSPLVINGGSAVCGVHVGNSGSPTLHWNVGSLLPIDLPKESAGELRRRMALEWEDRDFHAEEGFESDDSDQPVFYVPNGNVYARKRYRAKGKKISARPTVDNWAPGDAWADWDDDTTGHLDNLVRLGFSVPPKERVSLNGTESLNSREAAKSCSLQPLGDLTSTKASATVIGSQAAGQTVKSEGSDPLAALTAQLGQIQSQLSHLMLWQQQLSRMPAFQDGFNLTAVQQPSTHPSSSKPTGGSSPAKSVQSQESGRGEDRKRSRTPRGRSSSPRKGGQQRATTGSSKAQDSAQQGPASSHTSSAQKQSGKKSSST